MAKTKKKVAKKTSSTPYDLKKKVMLALVIDRPLHKRMWRLADKKGVSMKEFVLGLINKAV
jgi:predicted HicB family RNase H-like nuclease